MMLAATTVDTILAFFFAVVAVLLMIVILLQRGKGVGLAGAFGGTGGHAAFGAKTGDFLTWVTIVGAAVLLLFAIVLNYAYSSAGPAIGPTAGAGQTPPAGEAPAEAPDSSWHPTDLARRPDYADAAIFGEPRA